MFDRSGEPPTVYNAFVMPYDAKGKRVYGNQNISYIGTARSTWKENKKSYELIQGILLDVKHLMSCMDRLAENEIAQMAKAIDDAILLGKLV